jgi:uncharacterized protein YmfQ (DUF2313 family)
MSDDRRHGDPAALDLSLDDHHSGAMALLPTGAVWPRDPFGVLSRTVRGLAGVHHHAWTRVKAMLNEADPRSTYETIDMWETDCGLPDPCVENPPTALEARRAAVITKRQMGATTTPMQFIAIAASLGYEIEIKEFRPFRAWSPCNSFLNTNDGTDAAGNPRRVGWSHCWRVRVLNRRAVYWMRTNSPCNSFLRTWTTGDLECIFERIKPAHTRILWEYPTP